MRPLSNRLLVAVALSVAAAAFAGSILQMWDTDTFHHLAMGRHIARHGLAPGEPFLFPFLGAPTGPVHYWLGSLAIYGWYALTGPAGLQLLPAVVAALLAAVLLLDSSPRAGRHTPLSLAAAALPLALALLGFRYRAVARPELFATLLAALVLFAVRRFEDGRPRLIYAFPAVALVWANLHPSVVAGIGIVAVLAATALGRLAFARLTGRTAPDDRARRDALVAAGVVAAGVLAGFVSPAAGNPLAVALRFASAHYLPHASVAADPGMVKYDQTVLSHVPEMRPLGAHFWIEPFGLLLVVTALSLVLRRRAARPREVLTVAVFAALAAGGARFAVLLAVVCAPIAARNLGELVAALPARMGTLPARAAGALALVLAAAAALPLATTERAFCFGMGLRPGAYPVRGVDYLERLGFRGRLFNTFHFGGYLSWREVGPPYQDGRGMIQPGEERAAMGGPIDRDAFRTLDGKYRFDALLLAYPDEKPSSTARFQAFLGDTDWTADRSLWSLVAFDDGGLLYLRRDGAYASRAAADEYRVAMPGNAAFSPRPEQIPLLLGEFRRSVREAPQCVLCRYYEGIAALSLGLGEEARAALAGIPQPGCFIRPLALDEARAAAGLGAGAP